MRKILSYIIRFINGSSIYDKIYEAYNEYMYKGGSEGVTINYRILDSMYELRIDHKLVYSDRDRDKILKIMSQVIYDSMSNRI